MKFAFWGAHHPSYQVDPLLTRHHHVPRRQLNSLQQYLVAPPHQSCAVYL
jgi:hypothetical protein